MVTFSPAQPWRAKTHLVPSKAAGDSKPEEVPTHFVGPFVHSMDLDERENPSSTSALRESQSVR